MSTVLYPTPSSVMSSKVPAVKGFRKAYMQKYVPNTATIQKAEKTSGGAPERAFDRRDWFTGMEGIMHTHGVRRRQFSFKAAPEPTGRPTKWLS